MNRIGPYVLSQRIGAGGMAEVWMAHRAALGANKTVALKLLAPNLASKPQYREMFMEEARLSMLLNNSNIVQVFDAGEERGECYMVMEWIDGVNLAELQAALWENGRSMPVDVAMYVAGEVLRALDYAHNLVHEGAAAIVHRDVSPANILLSLAGEVKLTDFGVARFGSEETSGLHVKGKLRYMPPEQLRGQSKEGTVDIFSVGALLHEMLDGRKFRGANSDEAELLGMIFTGVVPDLTNASNISAELEALRRRLLDPDLGHRVASAREALELLAQCPGYRQAAHELEALVRWVRGHDPGASDHRPGRFSPAVAPVFGAHASDTSVSRRSLPALPGSGCESGQTGARRIARRRRAASVSAALCGLVFGCLGVGFAVTGFNAEADSGEASATLVDERPSPVEVAPERPVAAEQPTKPPPKPPPKPELEPAAKPQTEAEPKPEPKPEAKPKPVIKHDPVTVKFVAGAFNFAYVKVGGKSLLIEPGGALKLSPGVHNVHVRFSKSEKWRYFGKIKIAPKRAHLVQLIKPKGLRVSP